MNIHSIDTTTFDPIKSRRSFRLAATDYALLVLLPELVRRVGRAAPGIQLVTSAVNPDLGLDYIREGRIDLLLAYFVVTRVPKHFHSRPLLNDTYTVLARKDHPRISGRLTQAAFAGAGHVVVAPRDSFQRGPLDSALSNAGFKRDIRVMVPYYLIVPHVVATTNRIAVVPSRTAESFRGVPIREYPLPFDVPDFRVEMVWEERNHGDRAHKWLREELAATSAAIASN